MKKVVLPVLILVVAGFAGYQFLWKKDNKKEEKQKPLAVGENTGTFNQSFGKLLIAYYGVKDALVASDTAKATAAALELGIAADSLKVDEIKGDSTGVIKETARTFAGTISGSAKGLAGEKDLSAKRKEFEMIADAMWSLTRTVRYDGQKVYWQYCPMAFNNKGAYWMSNEREIKNPYFGHDMLECGEVQDSLDYAK
jgi:hypothetical protein